MNMTTGILLSIMLSFISFSCFSNEIYKTVDQDGNVTFSFIVPANSRIVETVSIKKLIKKISVIKGASAQNIKIKAITKKLTDSRIKRNKKIKKSTEKYNEEITLIQNQRIDGLKKLSDGKYASRSKSSYNHQVKKSIIKMHKLQE